LQHGLLLLFHCTMAAVFIDGDKEPAVIFLSGYSLNECMADRVRFGPAGTPWAFKELRQPIFELPRFVREEGLDALEYQAVRWGQEPQIKRENAEKLGANAKAHDVWLSMHGSYFISLQSKKDVAEASKRRLLACATAAQWMDAHLVVFHPGFYMGHGAREVLHMSIKIVRNIVEDFQSIGIRVKLGLETMGKRSQFGSLDEVLTVCEQVEQTTPVIDWSHIHARTQGGLVTQPDFIRVIDQIEKRLGREVAKNLHCHFSRIEFSARGEVRHHTLAETRYGPDFRVMAQVVEELGLKPVFICESPLIDVDAQKMRDIFKTMQEKG
jgi:deoxyribonuclease-4